MSIKCLLVFGNLHWTQLFSLYFEQPKAEEDDDLPHSINAASGLHITFLGAIHIEIPAGYLNTHCYWANSPLML